MSIFKYDTTTGHILREGGSFQRLAGVAETQVQVSQRLRLFRGEAFLRKDKGVRYLTREDGDPGFLGKGADLEVFSGEIAGEILDVPGMVSVEDVDIARDPSSRELTIDWQGTYQASDQSTRIPLRDSVQVGSA